MSLDFFISIFSYRKKKEMPLLAVLTKCNGWGEGRSQQEAWDAFRDICGHLELQILLVTHMHIFLRSGHSFDQILKDP